MDDLNNPFIKYFSYIILGLVLSIGWVVFRIHQKRTRHKQEKGGNLESYLLEAEREVRQKAKAKKQGLAEDQMNDVLAPSPDEEEKRERLRHLASGYDENKEPESDEDLMNKQSKATDNESESQDQPT